MNLAAEVLPRPRLRDGSRVAVVSPASAAKAELVAAGVERLRAFGYEPVVMPHALDRGPLYYAGSAKARAEDLHAALADPSIDGVICTRGGWGSAELLPLLDQMGTAAIVRAQPKVFVGYSDHTSLHSWFWNQCGLPTFYAPMVAADWAKADGVDMRSWLAAVRAERFGLHELDGMRILREGFGAGRLLGGCLSIVCQGLGTPWALRTDEPWVLFAEDIGTKPYQWDRYLQHLKFAGLLKNIRGVVLGDMSASVESSDIALVEAACLHALRDIHVPVSIGLRCGHLSSENRSVVLGAMVELRCDGQPSLEFVGE